MSSVLLISFISLYYSDF